MYFEKRQVVGPAPGSICVHVTMKVVSDASLLHVHRRNQIFALMDKMILVSSR